MNEQILKEVLAELERQQALEHGGDTEEFDKTNTCNDWIAYINAYAGRAARRVFRNDSENQGFRENMIKVIALGISAVRAYDKGYCK